MTAHRRLLSDNKSRESNVSAIFLCKLVFQTYSVVLYVRKTAHVTVLFTAITTLVSLCRPLILVLKTMLHGFSLTPFLFIDQFQNGFQIIVAR
ncbi:hypothetical protein CI610_02891 [invertebrate metagenome]|uniref:Uncharacterized protein n=1 Tax=invertebrate metagenome TaxID=1711999 RepID=A0A2H9T4P2_9ZZZZ